MSQFSFGLESVSRLRERQRDSAAESLRQALHAKQKLEQQVQALLQQRASQWPRQIEAMRSVVNSQNLLESERFQLHLLNQVGELRSQISLIDAECTRRRAILVDKEQKVQSLEKLRQRRWSEWQENEARREQNALDNWAAMQYWKKGVLSSEDDQSI